MDQRKQVVNHNRWNSFFNGEILIKQYGIADERENK
jgi:hypothetical protein